MAKRSSNGIRNRKHIKNAHLLETLSYLGEVQLPTSIEFIQYNSKQTSTKSIAPSDKLKDLIKDDCISWFKITGISDAEVIFNICKSFGIPRFDVKDLLSGRHVTKVITYEHNTFILMSGCFTTESHELDLDHIAFILGDNYIISLQENGTPIFTDVQEAIKNSKVQIREKGTDYLLYILLNCVQSLYNDTVLKLATKIDNMEDKLIENDTKGIDIMRFIRIRKNDYSLLKRAVSSMREEYSNLLHNDNRLIKRENKIYFNDFDDRLRTSSDDLDIFHESINSLSNLYFNNNNLKMNNVITKLTVVSTIFIPLTFMVGVWGMNFDYMPELKWKFGYIVAWAIMILIVIIALLFLKKKKWL
ncbi:magnesium transporter [Dysgonomonas alginatilytica]|uniref:Magnesium transport protein CorA n=1 Tax=Dysgonomonas alginatilytica TaxID=1605892 RepID=A0A2V3PLE5_9BACT|nr:magnesium/cobalt transporter CorA [Dysgonomonas alginatilytica]PXV62655.1 magnesium transporter [Dysgonomonas alginatilytica]